jgi:hypothetical protein
MLILLYWYCYVDIVILILLCWYCYVDIVMLILLCWYCYIDIVILILLCWYCYIDVPRWRPSPTPPLALHNILRFLQQCRSYSTLHCPSLQSACRRPQHQLMYPQRDRADPSLTMHSVSTSLRHVVPGDYYTMLFQLHAYPELNACEIWGTHRGLPQHSALKHAAASINGWMPSFGRTVASVLKVYQGVFQCSWTSNLQPPALCVFVVANVQCVRKVAVHLGYDTFHV